MMDRNSSNTNTRHTIYQTSRKEDRSKNPTGKMVGIPQFGNLQTVDAKTYWGEEPTKFVTWLAQEGVIKMLGQTLDMELELLDQMALLKSVDADIICKDLLSDSPVLILNEFEAVNDLLIGKLLTDVARLDGGVFIVIANGFPEKHQLALDWLNTVTNGDHRFYGLEIELWQIGNSAIAPKFQVVCRPHDSVVPIRMNLTPPEPEEEVQEEPRDVQLEFWSEFKNHIETQGTFLEIRKQYPSGWMDFALGRSDFWLSVVMNNKELHVGVALVIAGTRSREKYQRLHENMSRIETEIGTELEWDFKKDREFNFIYRYRPDSDPFDRSSWTDQFEWLLQNLELFHSVFSPRVQIMDTTDYFMSEVQDG